MPRFLRKRKLIVFFTSIIIVVILIGFSLNRSGQTNIVTQFITDTVGLVQNIVYQPVQFFIGLTDNVKDIRDVYKQNEVLKSELQEYKTLAFKVNELEKENEELRSLLNIDVLISDYTPIRATVISRSPEQFFDQIKVNKGQLHGVKPNMAVITADGMIGKVSSASQMTSVIQLLSGFDEHNRISVVVEENENVFGLIEGFNNDTQTLLFRELENSGELEEGQTVISSGLGGMFPRGLLIGTISSVELDQYGLTQMAHVEPAADFIDINHVIIVDRDIFSPIIDDETEIEEEEE